jgi:hypothetical protein
MFSNHKKIEYYDFLNRIKRNYLKIENPFNIIESDVKLTYKDIDLQYIKNKNYFVTKRKTDYKSQDRCNENSMYRKKENRNQYNNKTSTSDKNKGPLYYISNLDNFEEELPNKSGGKLVKIHVYC